MDFILMKKDGKTLAFTVFDAITDESLIWDKMKNFLVEFSNFKDKYQC